MLHRLRTLLQPAHRRAHDPLAPTRDTGWLALEPRILLDGAIFETAADNYDADGSAVVDVNGPAAAGTDRAVDYPDRDTATHVNAADAFVADAQDDIVRFEIQFGGDTLENRDAIRIGDRFVNFSRSEGFNDVVVGGAVFDMAYDAATQLLVITPADAATATIPQETLTAILRDMAYANIDLDPRQGTITFDYRAIDAQGFTSASARTAIIVDSQGAYPYIDLDPDRSSSVGDVFRATYREGTGLSVSVADGDAEIVSRTNEPIRQVVIELGNPQEFDQLSFQVPEDIEGITANSRRMPDGTLRVTILTSSQSAGLNYEDLTRVIQSVSFTNESEDPSDLPRVINVQLLEGQTYGVPTRLRIEVVPVNDAPTLDLELGDVTEFGPDYATTWREDGPSVAIIAIGSSDIEDVDDETLAGAQIVNFNAEAGDVLYLDGGLPPGIAADVSSDGTTVQFSGEASIAAYTRAIETVRFTTDPQAPVEGVRQVRVTLNDGLANSNTATALVTVEAENDAPNVQSGPLDDLQRGLDGTVLDPVEASESFFDVVDDDLRYALVGDVPDWLSIDGETGRIIGTPPADASQRIDPQTGREGRYEVWVRASDPDNAFAEAVVVYQIENPAPVAIDDIASANDGGPRIAGSVLAGEANDSDPDGDTLTVAFVEDGAENVGRPVPGSAGGSFVVQADGNYTFDPGTDFLFLLPGESRTTSITYRVSDGEGGFDTASLVVTVMGSNNAPQAEDDLLAVQADRPLSGNLMIDNGNGPDTDPDGDRLTVMRVNGATFTPGTAMDLPSGASLTLRTDGTYSYDPGTAFRSLGVGQTGTDTFTYTVRDPFGVRSQATVTVTVTGTNERPIPLDPSRPSIDPGDPDAPPTDPDDPRAPPLDRQDYIPVQARVDGETMEPFPLEPWFGDPDAGDVLTYSVEASSLPDGLVFDPATGTISGTFAADASQSGTGGGDTGVYVVPVTATDQAGLSFTTNLTFAVANPGPIARDDAFATAADAVVSGNVVTDGDGADLDPDGDTLFVTRPQLPVAGSAGGTFTFDANGTMSFDPGSDFDDLIRGETRVTTATYTVSDRQGGTAEATVAVTVTGTNAGPRVTDAAAERSGTDAVPLDAFDASTLFEDPDGDALTYALGSDAPDWMTIDPATGEITGLPPRDASGAVDEGVYRVTLVASDGLAEASTTVDWRIVNPPPLAEDDAIRVPADAEASMPLLVNDTDPDGDQLTIVGIEGEAMEIGDTMTLPSGATVTMEGPNDLVWRPSAEIAAMMEDEGFTESFDYTIVDADGARSQAVASVAVFGTQPRPLPPEPPICVHPLPPLVPTPPITALPIEGVTGDPILTTAIETITPLSPPIGIDPGGPVPILTQAVERAASVGSDVTLFGDPSLTQALDAIAARDAVEARWIALAGKAFEGHELTVSGTTFRTVVAGDVTHLDLGSLGRSFERWRVLGDGAGRIYMLDRNILQIERPADRDHVHLDITARAADGTRWQLPLRVDTVHGELRAEGSLAPAEVARRPSFAERVDTELATTPMLVTDGARVVDLSRPIGTEMCEVPDVTAADVTAALAPDAGGARR